VVIAAVILMIVSFCSVPVRSDEISDPRYTNEMITEINTPNIEPGNDDKIVITLQNPYMDFEDGEMKNTTLMIEIFYHSDLGVENDISEIESPPVFSNEELSSMEEIDELSPGETEDLEYLITTAEDTEEGVYSLRLKLTFSMDDEREVMKSRGFFTTEEWRESDQGDDLEYLNVSGLLLDSSFEVRDPVPRWPQYALGIVAGFSGILAVMFYMQEKYGSFPRLEKTFDSWSDKLQKLRSRLK